MPASRAKPARLSPAWARCVRLSSEESRVESRGFGIHRRGVRSSRERRAAQVERLARVYQRWISPSLHALGGSLLPMPSGCRYQPTCSEYAAIAVARYGWWRGSVMALARVARCHPWSRRGRRGGFDPVP